MTIIETSEGKEAYLSGKSLGDNPYEPFHEREKCIAWEEGFLAAEKGEYKLYCMEERE